MCYGGCGLGLVVLGSGLLDGLVGGVGLID